MEKDRPALMDAFGQVCKNLNKTHVPIFNLVFFCSHGKHRSVGVATLTSMAMRRASDGWRIKDVNPLMKQYWSRKKCPYINCPECLQDNDVKQKCYEDALELFKKQWHACEGL